MLICNHILVLLNRHVLLFGFSLYIACIRSGFSFLLCHTAVWLFEQKIFHLILSAKIIFLIYYSHNCECFCKKEISLKFSQIKETYRNQYNGIISWFDKLYFSWKHLGWNLVEFPRMFYVFYRCIYIKQNKLLRLFIYFLTLFFYLSRFTIRKNKNLANSLF